MRVVLIEGMPGSGKSTLADNLSNLLKEQGIQSCSYQELLKDHPVFPCRRKGSDVHDGQYLKKELSSWRKFVAVNSHKNVTYFFDAAPFQNSVRFAMESCNSEKCEWYISELSEILDGVNPSLIYLRPDCAFTQTDFCIRDKGEAWSKNVSAYLESTCYSRERDWKGVDGMSRFWSNYVSLCDSLVSKVTMPKRVIRSVPGEWSRIQNEALSFIGEAMA